MKSARVGCCAWECSSGWAEELGTGVTGTEQGRVGGGTAGGILSGPVLDLGEGRVLSV